MAVKKKNTTSGVNDGKYAGMFYRKKDDFVRAYQETGIVGFDLAISNGKGLPVGGCILMYSAPGSGKSTLCADIAQRMLEKNEKAGIPYKCLYIDIEGGSDGLALNNGLAAFVEEEHGCRLNYVPVGGMTWTKLEEMFKDILNNVPPMDDVKLVIIDSLSSIQSDAQADKEKKINSGDFGSSAKDRYNLYNKYLLDLKKKGVTFLLISQQRQKQGATTYEDQKKAATADGDDHVVDCILKLSRSGGGNDAETKKTTVISTATGKEAKIADQFYCTIQAPKKNRFCAGLPAVPVLVRVGQGIINRYTVRNLLASVKLLKINGSGKSRTVSISDELVNFVGGDNPYVQESDIRTANRWIALNVDPIKEFLKARGLYTLVIPKSAEQEYDDDDE